MPATERSRNLLHPGHSPRRDVFTSGHPAISGRAPRDERRPDVERRLFAAVDTLCADGTPFAEVSIARLVREAGLGRATFYLYFPLARHSCFA
ncbi:TetR family transcriptional regulator [Mycobacterium branderi]|nr:TetR family transcriptional regulator [Mycobacterium branderi]